MSGEHRNATENKAMMKICAFIVDKRNLFFLLFAMARFCAGFSLQNAFADA